MKRLVLGLVVVLAGVAVRANGLEDEKPNDLITRVYSVGDLVLTAKQQADFDPLVKLLISSVAPDTWTINDGKDGRSGKMTPFPKNGSLIIHTTPDVHDQIIERLRQLRRLPAVRGPFGDEAQERRAKP